MADYLGLTSKTVSRCFSKLARCGLISVRAKRAIVATDGVAACVCR
ncbi:MAG: helix-turn-helix domain-containing protein [Steroidobacteraceae bacterium]